MPILDQIRIVDKRIYYIGESDLSEFHEETGWYSDFIYDEGEIDTYGPFETKDNALSCVGG